MSDTSQPQLDSEKTYIDVFSFDGMNDVVAVYGRINLKLLVEFNDFIAGEDCPVPWGTYRHEVVVDPGDTIPHPSNPAFVEVQPAYYEIVSTTLVEEAKP